LSHLNNSNIKVTTRTFPRTHTQFPCTKRAGAKRK
jgi:hypothetical protein